MKKNPLSGRCLCGKIHYQIQGALRPVIACHCMQCRKTSGHYVAASACRKEDLQIYGTDFLRWYQSSETAHRGFCSRCGSNLFWEKFGSGNISIMAGGFDMPTNLHIAQHIYVKDKADYYDLGDDIPKFDTRDGDLPISKRQD